MDTTQTANIAQIHQLQLTIKEMESTIDDLVIENKRLRQQLGPPERPELNGRTAAVYDAIVEFWATKGYAPSWADIVAMTDITSKSVVNHHVSKLCEAGIVERDHGVARSVRIVKTVSK